MADQDDPNAAPPPSPGASALPQPYSLPVQLLEKWIAIPPNHYIQAQLTRHDLDNLFFGLTKQGSAHQSLEQALVRWSNGDVNGANEKLQESRRLAIEADNSVRHFFAAIMIAATTK